MPPAIFQYRPWLIALVETTNRNRLSQQSAPVCPQSLSLARTAPFARKSLPAPAALPASPLRVAQNPVRRPSWATGHTRASPNACHPTFLPVPADIHLAPPAHGSANRRLLLFLRKQASAPASVRPATPAPQAANSRGPL